MPLVIAIIGKSDAGKTFLITRLIPEMKRRGYSVAAIKSCPHGFDLDVEGKDSWCFTRAGAEGVLLQSPSALGLIRARSSIASSLNEIARHYFPDFDLVLAEGFAQDLSTRRIEVLRKGISEQLESPPETLIAIVADFPLSPDKPTFDPDELSGIGDFLERSIGESKEGTPLVELKQDGTAVFLNEFVQSVMKSTIAGLIAPLKKEEKEYSEIQIRIRTQ